MPKKFHKFLIDDDLLKKYKVLCIELNLSMTKQTEKIIEQFIQVQKDNVKIQKQLKKMGAG